MNWLIPTLLWYVVTLVATLACLPLTLFLFRKTVGQGSAFARPIGMLLTIWPVWYLSSVLPVEGIWSGTLLWAFLLPIAIIGWTQIVRRSLLKAGTLFHFIVAEGVFASLFMAALWFRGFGPQLDFTEKPSELMMLSSVMQSTSMPPTDAWLSGHTINYYYFGYAMWGGFGKMTGIEPAAVFNLALISTFAMSFVAISGLVAMIIVRFHGIWSARIGGILAAVIALIIGNWWASWQWFTGRMGDGYWQGIGWKASRILRDSRNSDYGYNPITEFPSFSFILGDLHPHVMALPFVVTSLAIAWVLITLGRFSEDDAFWPRNLISIIISGAILGSLYVINSWDFPTFAGIAIFALVLGSLGIGWKDQIIAVIVLVASSVIAWLPFHLQFSSPTQAAQSDFADVVSNIPIIGGVLGSIGIYKGLPTSLEGFFGVFGFQYIILLTFLVVEITNRRMPIVSQRYRRMGERPEPDPVAGYFALVFGALCLIGAIVLPMPLLLFCGLPVIVVWLLLERDARLTPANVALVLFALSLILLLIPEFFYVNDIYGGSRMNTVFKVSYQVWLLMSVASGAGLIAIWKNVSTHIVLRYAMPAAAAGLILFGLAYPIAAGHQWLDWRSPARAWVGIDGLLYLNSTPGSAESGEYEAIAWLRENARDDDVILAAGGGEWDSAVGRVSSGSGVPSIIGWTGHEHQWHLGDDAMLVEMTQRINDIDTMYAGTPPIDLLDRYGITLLYLGPVELHGTPGAKAAPGYMSLTPVPTANDPDFPGDGWSLVFQHGDVRIYRREAP